MQKNTINKGLVVVIVLLVLFLLVSGYYIYKNYEKKSSNDTAKESKVEITEVSNDYTYESIQGLYVFKTDIVNDSYDKYQLYLYDNGTFVYRMNIGHIMIGYIGNYVINNNKIDLNYMFKTGESTDLIITKGQRIITINNDDDLLDEISSNEETSMNNKNVTLSLATEDEKEEYKTSFNNYDVEDILSNYTIVK